MLSANANNADLSPRLRAKHIADCCIVASLPIL
jgi:hypothetical protein